jgi:hypothetical protein
MSGPLLGELGRHDRSCRRQLPHVRAADDGDWDQGGLAPSRSGGRSIGGRIKCDSPACECGSRLISQRPVDTIGNAFAWDAATGILVPGHPYARLIGCVLPARGSGSIRLNVPVVEVALKPPGTDRNLLARLLPVGNSCIAH